MRTLHVVLGPTASGKTAYAIELARGLGDAEIVNADSRQLYRGLTVGTAKILPQEMQGIPHHLLDVLDPREEATASWYQRRAREVIDEIHARGKTPILVGGSMLYVAAVIDGLEFPPKSSPEVRQKLSAEYDADAGQSLYRELLDCDPDTAMAFSKENKPYVVRAMEIMRISGNKPSSVRTKLPSPYDLKIIGIERDRGELAHRINERTRELFAKGWVEEVRELLRRGYTKDDPAMKSHGYREIMEWIERQDLSMAKLQEIISAKTRQYAKRQMTWWRGDPRIQWVRP